MPQYQYDPYLTKSSARGLKILGVAMIPGGLYLAKVSQFAWRTNTMVRVGNTGRSLLWPWEGFLSAFLMIVVGVFAFYAATVKARAWRKRQEENARNE